MLAYTQCTCLFVLYLHHTAFSVQVTSLTSLLDMLMTLDMTTRKSSEVLLTPSTANYDVTRPAQQGKIARLTLSERYSLACQHEPCPCQVTTGCV